MSLPEKTSALANWSAEEVEQARQWVQTWNKAGEELENVWRRELRELDTYRTIQSLCGPGDYNRPPRAPKPTSGLVEQQRIFMKTKSRE